MKSEVEFDFHKVLILCRTRSKNGFVSVVGICIKQGSVHRLLDLSGNNIKESTGYRPNQLWRLKLRTHLPKRPPHLEDANISIFNYPKRLDVSMSGIDTLNRFQLIKQYDLLHHSFKDLLKATKVGKLFIPASVGDRLDASIEFVRLNQPLFLFRDVDGRQFYEHADELSLVSYIGSQPAPERINAGTVLVLSLSRLFEKHAGYEGYFLQLAGCVTS